MTEEIIDLHTYTKTLRSKWRKIATFVLITTILAGLVSYLLPKTYRSEVVLMPLSEKKGGGGLASMLGGELGGLGGLMALSKSPSTQLIVLLDSRSLAEQVISRLKLLPLISPRNQNLPLDEAAHVLKKWVTVSEDRKTQTISISVEAPSPQTALEIANTYVSELQTFIHNNSFTLAKHYRIFLENQLEQNRADLLEAGKELNDVYKDRHVSTVDSKLDVSVDIPKFDTGDTASIDSNYGILDASLKNLDSEMQKTKTVRQVPQQVYLQYLILKRELLAKMSALLTQQYEMAKMDEVREDLAFQIVDPAILPRYKNKPKRGVICLITMFVSTLLAGAYTLLKASPKHTSLECAKSSGNNLKAFGNNL